MPSPDVLEDLGAAQQSASPVEDPLTGYRQGPEAYGEANSPRRQAAITAALIEANYTQSRVKLEQAITEQQQIINEAERVYKGYSVDPASLSRAAENLQRLKDERAALETWHQNATQETSTYQAQLTLAEGGSNPRLPEYQLYGEQNISSQQAAQNELIRRGIAQRTELTTPVTSPGRDESGRFIANTSGYRTGYAPGLVLSRDPATLTQEERSLIQQAGFKLPDQDPNNPSDPLLVAGATGVGAFAYPEILLARSQGRVSNLGAAMVVRAVEEKQKGRDIAAGSLFAAGGAVAGVGGVFIGGDILGDVKRNPLSAAIQGAVITVTAADIAYGGANWLNKRLGITNKAWGAKLTDQQWLEAMNPEERWNFYPSETQPTNPQIQNFNELKIGVTREGLPTVKLENAIIRDYYETPKMSGLDTLDTEGIFAKQAAFEGSGTPAAKGFASKAYVAPEPSGIFDNPASLWSKGEKTTSTLDLTDILNRQRNFDINADLSLEIGRFEESETLAKAAKDMSGTAEGVSTSGGNAASGLISESKPFPSMSRGQLPNPYYQTASTAAPINIEINDNALLKSSLSKMGLKMALEDRPRTTEKPSINLTTRSIITAIPFTETPTRNRHRQELIPRIDALPRQEPQVTPIQISRLNIDLHTDELSLQRQRQPTDSVPSMTPPKINIGTPGKPPISLSIPPLFGEGGGGRRTRKGWRKRIQSVELPTPEDILRGFGFGGKKK